MHILVIASLVLEAGEGNTFTKGIKSSNPSELSHLKLISILQALSKLLESVLQQQLSDYVLSNIIPGCQSGFRPQHSSTTAMIQITHEIYRC